MQRFHFRLAALLKLRHLQKEQAQVKFAEALAKLQHEQEKLRGLEAALQNSTGAFRSAQDAQKHVSIELLKSYAYYFDKIKREIVQQSEVIAHAQAYRQECLAILTEAIKQCKIVEKLKEKRLQEYREEVLQEEQKLLDEIGSQLHVREV